MKLENISRANAIVSAVESHASIINKMQGRDTGFVVIDKGGQMVNLHISDKRLIKKIESLIIDFYSQLNIELHKELEEL